MDNTNEEKDYVIYLLIWRIFLLHVCVYWIMKQILQEKYFVRNYHRNKDDSVITNKRVEELIDKFKEKEAHNFRYMPDRVTNDSKISKEKMEKDYSNSLEAIKKYLIDWLDYNCEELKSTGDKK